MPKYNTIIFDLDGTLLYTLEDLTDSVNYALRQHEYPLRTMEEVRHFVGNGIHKLIERSVPESCSSTEVEKTFLCFKNYYKDNCNNKTKAYDGVNELLKELHARNYKLAIVSNKVDSAVKLLNEIYFKDVIKVAIGATDAIAKKPAPDTVLQALKELDSIKEEAVYIGDSEVDVQTAKNSGLDCISVTWGFREKDVLEKAGATTYIDHPIELLSLLDNE